MYLLYGLLSLLLYSIWQYNVNSRFSYRNLIWKRGQDMTLIVALEKEDKIAILSDTRTTLRQNGEKKEYNDNTIKIHPIKNIVLSVIGASGIKVNKQSSNQSDIHLYDIAEKLAENYSTIDASSFLRELSNIWNSYITRTDYQGEVPFWILACEWKNGTAQIFQYSSKLGTVGGPSYAYVSPDGQEIMFPKYLNPAQFDQLSYEEIIERSKEGFSEVMMKQEGVGGEVVIYELNRNPELSKWLVSPSWL